MLFDYYKSAVSSKKREREVDEREFYAVTDSEYVKDCIAKFRAGDKSAKRKLPAWTPMGKTTTGQRRLEDVTPTGLVMLDIDHISDEKMLHVMECFNNINTLRFWNVLLVHITPSGHGLRVIFSLPDGCNSIVEAQDKMVRDLHLDEYGDYDGACKDLTRLSFFPQRSDIKYSSEGLFFDYESEIARITTGFPAGEPGDTAEERETLDAVSGGTACNDDAGNSEGTSRRDFKYGNHLVREIVTAYVNEKGEPEEGQTHNFYNNLVSNFRHICNNDPGILIDVLPLFGQTRKVRMSQCESITRKNTSSSIPKEFYFWLKDNNYLALTKKQKDDLKEVENYSPYQEEKELLKRMPPLPPVFREYINIAPEEFKIPTLYALLPIMGTAASYLQAKYIDDEMHTPSFISIISAPAGQGKSFVNKFLSTDASKSTPRNLLHKICLRDEISAAREQLYALFANTKGANEKGSIPPKVSTRIASPIISQPELLQKMRDNKGYHMFTFAAEMDTFSKGVKAGGGDKNDMYRMAWDNSIYSQQFKTNSTFKGAVPLYLNVLITGTPAQCDRFFKDIENGLVTRCSFTDLGNQDFAEYKPWKQLSRTAQDVIERFKERCDANTYTEPLVVDRDSLDDYGSEEEFDKNVPWKYQFRERQTIDMSFMKKDLLKWLNKQRILSAKNMDHARDSFRRRTAVKAFRLALLCHACWPKVGVKEQKIIRDFALWFADVEIMKSLKLWGEQYNEFRAKEKKRATSRPSNYSSLMDAIPDEFTKEDVATACKKYGVFSQVKDVIYSWNSRGFIKKIGNKKYKKLKV